MANGFRLDHLIAHGQSSVARIYVRNILNPLLWSDAIVCPIFLGAAWGFRNVEWIRNTAFIISALPPVLTIVAFVYFALADPDRLQSEEFRLHREELLLQQQQHGGPAQIDVRGLPAIANPVHRAPEAGAEGKSS